MLLFLLRLFCAYRPFALQPPWAPWGLLASLAPIWLAALGPAWPLLEPARPSWGLPGRPGACLATLRRACGIVETSAGIISFRIV